MDLLRNRLVAVLMAGAFAFAVPACGDDDDKGAVEEIEKGANKAKDKIEKEGKELKDDVEGKKEKAKKNKAKKKTQKAKKKKKKD
jgi:hypothetical protein